MAFHRDCIPFLNKLIVQSPFLLPLPKRLSVQPAPILVLALVSKLPLLPDWNKKKLLDDWMGDKARACETAGVPVPPDGL